jgi:hypothetical protein
VRTSRKAALIGAVVIGIGLGGAGIAHSQIATPKPTAKPKATAKPVAMAKPKVTVKAASVAKPVVTTPHHTG